MLRERVHAVVVLVRHPELVALFVVNGVVIPASPLIGIVEPANKLSGYIRLYNRVLHKMRHEVGGRAAHGPKPCSAALAAVENLVIIAASRTPRNIATVLGKSAASPPCFSVLYLNERL